MKKFLLPVLAVLAMTASPSWAQKKAPKGACVVAELKNIGLYTYDVPTRIQLARDWLQQNAAQCSEMQLRMINSNRGSWFGHADTIEITTLLEGLYEAKVANKPELMAELFDPNGKPYSSGMETTRNPTRRDPVVSPTPLIMMPPGGEGGGSPLGVLTQLPAVNPAPAPSK